MIKHTYLKKLTLQVPTTVNSTGKIHLDEEGCIVEELTLEQQNELIDHPDFVHIADEPRPVGEQNQVQDEEEKSAEKDQEGEQSEDDVPDKTEGEKTEDFEDAAGDKGEVENNPVTEFNENDTRVVNGKGFIYKKNKAGTLMWLRHPELDGKGE